MTPEVQSMAAWALIAAKEVGGFLSPEALGSIVGVAAKQRSVLRYLARRARGFSRNPGCGKNDSSRHVARHPHATRMQPCGYPYHARTMPVPCPYASS